MSPNASLEREVAAYMADEASGGGPDRVLDQILSTTGRMRPEPRWLALIKEPPMRISDRVAVGSPTARLASIVIVILGLVLVATGTVVGAATLIAPPAIVVAQDGSGTVTTIAEAVALAVDGDTVLVRPGTYAESLTITEDITLRGDGDPAGIVVDITGLPTDRVYDGHELVDDGQVGGEPVRFAFLLDGMSGSISNLTIRGDPPIVAIMASDGAPILEHLVVDLGEWTGTRHMPLHLERSRATIRHSTFEGFVAAYDSAPTFEWNDFAGPIGMELEGDPVVRHNEFHDAPPWSAPGFGLAPGGLSVGDGSAVIEDNRFVDYVVAIQVTQDALFRRNTVSDGATAISINEGAAPLLEGNQVSGNEVGIEVVAAAPVIRDNIIRDNSEAGIRVVTGSPTLDSNTIESNALGVSLGSGSNVVMTGNTVCGNDMDVSHLGDLPPDLVGNTICEGASPAP